MKCFINGKLDKFNLITSINQYILYEKNDNILIKFYLYHLLNILNIFLNFKQT